MQKQITARHFDATSTLRTYADQSLNKLERYYDGITDAHIILTEDGTSQANKRAEITLNVYRQRLSAHDAAATHEEAIDHCVEGLRRQLLKYKSKLRRKDRNEHR